MSAIVSETRAVDACSEQDRRACFEVLRWQFVGVTWEDFVGDFEEKEAVMLLRDAATGELGGFSTLTRLRLVVDGEIVPAVFSGDTAVLPRYRSSLGLGHELSRYFVETYEQHPGLPVYWVLISKGWRTYRLLPFFFRSFFPRHGCATPPFEQAVMDAFGALKYPASYDAEAGVIRLGAGAPRVRPDGIDAVPPQADEHTAFFLDANPGYLGGDELVCVARIEPANLTQPTRRLLGPAAERLEWPVESRAR